MSFNIDTNEFDFKKVSNLKPENINGNYYSKMITKDNISVKFRNKFTLHSKKLVKELVDKIVEKNQEFKLVKESDEFIISKDFITLKIDTENKKFYKFCAELDDFNVKTAFFNSESWFGNKITYDVIDNLYKQIIRLDKNICPYLKVFLTNKTLNPEILEDIYDNHDNKDSEYIFNLEYYGLKFFKQQFTGIWLVTDIVKKEIICDEQAVLFFNQENEVELNLSQTENTNNKSNNLINDKKELEVVKEPEEVDEPVKEQVEEELVQELESVQEPKVVQEPESVEEPKAVQEQESVEEPESVQEQELNNIKEDIQLKVENKKIQNDELKKNKNKKLKKRVITKNKVKYLN